MAKVTTGYTFGCDRHQVMAAQLLADGKSYADIILCLWGVTRESDYNAYQKGYRKLKRWLADEGFQRMHATILKESVTPLVGRAVQRIGEQIDHSNPWVAQGAAREVLSRFGGSVLGDDDKSITIKVEGMPTIGVPGQDDGDC